METKKVEEKEDLRNEDPLAKEIDEMLGLSGDDNEPMLKNSTEEGSDEPLLKNSTEKQSESEEQEDSGEEVKEPEKEREEEEPPAKPSEEPTEPTETGWEAEKKELLDRIDKLTKIVDELSEYKLQASPKEPEKGGDKKQEDEDETPTSSQPAAVETPAEGFDFLNGTTIDVLIDEPERLNEALNKVYQTALMEAERRVFEKVLTSIPDIIVGHINRQTTIQGIVKNFYDQNRDLVSVKRTVAAVSNDVHAEHPDWDVPKVLDEAAKRVRGMLGLKGHVQTSETPAEESPAFAKSSGAKPPRSKKTSTLQDEIDELLNI